MLIVSDLVPLPIAGEFTVNASPVRVGCRDAMVAVRSGAAVRPADAATAERIAARLHSAGNDTRAAMFRRAFGVAATAPAPVVTTAPAVPAEPIAAFDPDTESARLRGLVDAAGDDVHALRALASRYQVDFSDRWGAKRLGGAITTAIAKRLAGGDSE